MKIKMAAYCAIIINLLCLLCPVHAADPSYLYIWDADWIGTKLYLSPESYMKDEETPYYLLNGYLIDTDHLQIGQDISMIRFYDINYYFCTKKITSHLPVSDDVNWCFKGILVSDSLRTPINYNPDHGDDKQLLPAKTKLEVLGHIKRGYIIRDPYGIGFVGGTSIMTDSGAEDAIFNMLSVKNTIKIAKEALEHEFPSIEFDAFNSSINFVPDFYYPEDSYFLVLFYPGEDSSINCYYVYLNALDGTIIDCYFAEQTHG